MEYNSTKRNLEKASGIVGLIESTICVAIYLAGLLIEISFNSGLVFVFLIFILYSITNLVFCAIVIPTPINKDGSISKRTGIRITIIIFSALSLQLVTLGLMIAVLCLKDYKSINQNNSQSVQENNIFQENLQIKTSNQKPEKLTIDQKIEKLKELKELEVITETQYKKSIEKIISEL